MGENHENLGGQKEENLSGDHFNSNNPTEKKTQLAGMFRNCFLEYASYVILERAVPDIDDGLKPVQRRILHAMQTLDDGRFNKVANIVGTTMQYHPHGDASIKDAIVQLGQKDLLIETQGNWGNILTGDDAAAGRYIEAMLSEFALEAVFSPKVTDWVPSYDGRKREPVTLPVKFPLLLAQGVEGIAVGLSSKILPHNFNEILDAAIACAEDREFTLFPDFQTGGLMDVSRYNDGSRGGNVKVRARIEKIDSKTLAITELPYGKTTPGLIASILAANDKGKIKIRKVDDNTSSTAEILVHLVPGTSTDKAIDALYAFTDCEVSISPNCCVIKEKKPVFLSISELLRHSVDHTEDLLRRELEIKLQEAAEARFYSTLEKIFIEERIYKDREVETAETMDMALDHLEKRLQPFLPQLYREITREDLLKLWEIKMARILKFNSDKAQRHIEALSKEMEELKDNIQNIKKYTADWFRYLKDKYGANYPRKTVIRNFENIEASKVAQANKRLFYDKKGGFVGTSLKDNEFLFNCSDLDDILLIYSNGTYKIVKVQDKLYVGRNLVHLGLFKKGDKRKIYNLIYQNGKPGDKDENGKDLGFIYKKRFYITGLTRDKEYNLTKGYDGSKIIYLSVNPNGEAESGYLIKDERNRKKTRGGKLNLEFEESGGRNQISERDKIRVNFADLEIKGKESLGNLVTKLKIETGKNAFHLESKGVSTLEGKPVWFDRSTGRLVFEPPKEENTDVIALGKFEGEDKILVITKEGKYKTTDFSETNHYPDNILKIEKYNLSKKWTFILKDPANGLLSVQRFKLDEYNQDAPRNIMERFDSVTKIIEDQEPVIRIIFGGKDSWREPIEIDLEEFNPIKINASRKKRLSDYEIENIETVEKENPTDEIEGAEGEAFEDQSEEEVKEPDNIASEKESISENDSPGSIDSTEPDLSDKINVAIQETEIHKPLAEEDFKTGIEKDQSAIEKGIKSIEEIPQDIDSKDSRISSSPGENIPDSIDESEPKKKRGRKKKSSPASGKIVDGNLFEEEFGADENI